MGKGTPKGEGQENGVTPRAEGKSGKRKDKIKSLTLSDVKAPISSGKKGFSCLITGLQIIFFFLKGHVSD